MTTSRGSTYIVAEIGQNHNGDSEIARQLIDVASMAIFDRFGNRELPRINAVKLTKRDMTEELTREAFDRPYDSPHAFGATYGEHRNALELSYEEHAELGRYAREKGLEFVETFTSIKTLQLLNLIQVDAIKVASRDLTNIPLLEEISKAGTRVILSTGMGGLPEIDAALEVITKYHDDIVILHCVSQYPAAYEHMNLLSIPFMRERYPFEIGLSDHSIGIVMAPAAVALGASVIEKHITLDRQMKGSDHQGSLEPEGLWRMVRDIRNVEIAMGVRDKPVPTVVQEAQKKLERSIALVENLPAGSLLKESDLCLLSPGTGLRWSERHKVIGRRTRQDLSRHSLVSLTDLEDDHSGAL